MRKEGWVCPKCERVYSEYVFECKHCNDVVSKIEAEIDKFKKVRDERQKKDWSPRYMNEF